MLLYGTSTPVQECVISVTVGNFVDFLKAGFGQLQRRVLVTPDVMLTFIKCTVEYFPRIHLQNSSLELAALSRHELPEQCWVHHPGLCGSRDFTTQSEAAGRLLGHLFFGEGAGLSKHEAHAVCSF